MCKLIDRRGGRCGGRRSRLRSRKTGRDQARDYQQSACWIGVIKRGNDMETTSKYWILSHFREGNRPSIDLDTENRQRLLQSLIRCVGHSFQVPLAFNGPTDVNLCHN